MNLYELESCACPYCGESVKFYEQSFDSEDEFEDEAGSYFISYFVNCPHCEHEFCHTQFYSYTHCITEKHEAYS